jgi:hypothetical protein
LKNILEDMHNLMLSTGNNDFNHTTGDTYIGSLPVLRDDLDKWDAIVDGSYDDALV